MLMDGRVEEPLALPLAAPLFENGPGGTDRVGPQVMMAPDVVRHRDMLSGDLMERYQTRKCARV